MTLPLKVQILLNVLVTVSVLSILVCCDRAADAPLRIDGLLVDFSKPRTLLRNDNTVELFDQGDSFSDPWQRAVYKDCYDTVLAGGRELTICLYSTKNEVVGVGLTFWSSDSSTLSETIDSLSAQATTNGYEWNGRPMVFYDGKKYRKEIFVGLEAPVLTVRRPYEK